MVKLRKNKEGKTMYPVCSWEANQHKLMNAYDRAWLRRHDEDWSDESCAEMERVQRALAAFDYVINGLVYATYEDSLLIKDIIWAYDLRH